MTWLFLLVTVCFVVVAEYFRDKSAFFEREMHYWRNEALRLNRQLRRPNHNHRQIEHDQFERN